MSKAPTTRVEEALALRMQGFFFAQQMQAARCDALLREAGLPNTPSQGDMHFSVLRRHGTPISAQKRIVARYWRRMYGSRWGEYEARRIADLAESISRQLATEPGQCRAHADELMRRLEADWPTLLRRIQWGPSESH